MAWRDIKREARADLHETLQIAALYLIPVSDSSGEGYEATACNVRLHTKFGALGDQKGTNFQFAELQEEIPSIIFLVSEIPQPQRGAIVSLEPGEAYVIDNVLPPDDITIKAHVSVLSAARAAGLPVPNGG